MQYTTNLNLSKPDYTDVIDVAQFNENFDMLDEEDAKNIKKTEKGAADGVATLDENGYLPDEFLTGTELFIKATEKGEADGVATLDENVKIPEVQIPDLDYNLKAGQSGNTNTTTFSGDGSIDEVITMDGIVTATRNTVFNDDDTITQSIVFYSDDGSEILKSITVNTTFNDDDTIMEVAE